MRLRQLKCPFAILTPTAVLGGKSAGCDSFWLFDLAMLDEIADGRFDEAKFVDATGCVYAVDTIEIQQVHWWTLFIWRAPGLFLPDGDGRREKVRVDMTFCKEGSYTLSQFLFEMKERALAHPSWWDSHSTKEEIVTMFDGCHSIEGAINEIGVLGNVAKSRKSQGSTKILDMR